MGTLVSDHIAGKLLGTVSQTRAKDNTAASLTNRPGSWHKQSPASSWLVIFQFNSKSWIIQEVTLHILRQRLQHLVNAFLQWLQLREWSEVGCEHGISRMYCFGR